MNSAKVEAISKRAQTFILRQQDYSVEKTAKIVGKSVNFLKIWAKRGKQMDSHGNQGVVGLQKFQAKF